LGIGDWAQSPIPNPQSPNKINYITLIFQLIFNIQLKQLKFNISKEKNGIYNRGIIEEKS